MEFEWGLSKELENLLKHGITFSEAVESFLHPQAFGLRTSSIRFRRNDYSGLDGSQRIVFSPQGLRNEAARFGSLDRLSDEGFGGCIMREPKLKDLTVDEAGTARLLTSVAQEKAVKITITIDTKNLSALRKASKRTGVPYQTSHR